MNVVYFDSNCFFCNSFVILILKETEDVYFADFKHSRLNKNSDLYNKVDSVIFEKNEKFYIKSDAVIQILLEMGSFYKLIGKLYSLIPRFLRDWEYDLFAKYRYRLAMGQTCRLFTEEEKKRILK